MARTPYQLLGIEPKATRAEVDAALTRRENQYRGLVRTGQRPRQQLIERVRNAHAVLLWRCAFSAGSRLLGFAARAASLIAVAILAFAAYSAVTRTLGPAGPLPQPGQARLAATHPTAPGDAIAAFPPAGR